MLSGLRGALKTVVGALPLLLSILLTSFTPTRAAAERVALVIGNANYQHAGALKNPINDAREIAKALKRLRFDHVTTHFDLKNSDLMRVLATFERRAAGADLAVIYFSGHGVEVDKQNYLVPIDARLNHAADVKWETVPLDKAMQSLERGVKLRLIILDACRDNPFRSRMVRTSTTRSVGRGLAPAMEVENTYVAYSAKHGSEALDGSGDNSPYTEALLDLMETPGLDLRLLFGKVRDRVKRETGGRQLPFTYGSLPGDPIYLKPGKPGMPGATPQPPLSEAATAWNSVQNSSSIAVLKSFIEQFPDTVYAKFAKARLQELEKGSAGPDERPSDMRLGLISPPTGASARAVSVSALHVDDRIDIFLDGKLRSSCVWQSNPGCDAQFEAMLAGVHDIRFKLTNEVYTGFCLLNPCGKWAGRLSVSVDGQQLWTAAYNRQDNSPGVKVDMTLRCDFDRGHCQKVK